MSAKGGSHGSQHGSSCDPSRARRRGSSFSRSAFAKLSRVVVDFPNRTGSIEPQRPYAECARQPLLPLRQALAAGGTADAKACATGDERMPSLFHPQSRQRSGIRENGLRLEDMR